MDHDLKLFAAGENVAAQAEGFSNLKKLKQHHRAAKEPEFARGIEALSRALRESSDGAERLTVAAILLQSAALFKQWRDRITESLKLGLVNQLSPLETVPDPDDRRYVATCWRFVEQPWVRSYLAAGAVQEEGSDPVRLECIEGVLSLSVDLAGALAELTEPMRRLNFSTEKPGDSKAKRLRRVLETVNSVYSTAPKEPGESAGVCVRRFLVESMQNVPAPVNPGVINELAEETLRLVQGIVRARFSCVTSEETYSAMEVVRGWYRDYSWENFAEQSPSANLIARDLKEALELLVRAGVADDGLYSRLVLAAGNDSRARKAALDVLHKNAGLPEDLARWLSGTPVRRKSAFAAENEAVQYDEFLADLLIDCSRLRSMEETFERDSMPEINVTVPQTAVALSRMLGTLRSIRNAVETAVRVRSLALRGQVGDVVKFLPTEHEMAGGLRPGIRTVRVVRPAVEAPAASGGRRIVRKGIVEPVE
jgi:hypothetical protein